MLLEGSCVDLFINRTSEALKQGDSSVALTSGEKTELGGLRPEHRRELNDPEGVNLLRYSELRQMYLHDTLALRQIDVFDPRSVYSGKRDEYADAINSGNDEKEKELKAWFEKHGYNSL